MKRNLFSLFLLMNVIPHFFLSHTYASMDEKATDFNNLPANGIDAAIEFLEKSKIVDCTKILLSISPYTIPDSVGNENAEAVARLKKFINNKTNKTFILNIIEKYVNSYINFIDIGTLNLVFLDENDTNGCMDWSKINNNVILKDLKTGLLSSEEQENALKKLKKGIEVYGRLTEERKEKIVQYLLSESFKKEHQKYKNNAKALLKIITDLKNKNKEI